MAVELNIEAGEFIHYIVNFMLLSYRVIIGVCISHLPRREGFFFHKDGYFVPSIESEINNIIITQNN